MSQYTLYKDTKPDAHRTCLNVMFERKVQLASNQDPDYPACKYSQYGTSYCRGTEEKLCPACRPFPPTPNPRWSPSRSNTTHRDTRYQSRHGPDILIGLLFRPEPLLSYGTVFSVFALHCGVWLLVSSPRPPTQVSLVPPASH